MTLPFAVRNPAILDELVPYVVATPFNLPQLDLAPFGLRIPAANVIDPLRLDSEPFLTLLHRLDGLTFGPEGMPMPRWVFYDCAELPGAIFGLARPAATVWPELRSFMGVPADYDGLVPLSMYIAIPMHQPGVWFGHNLASLAPVIAKERLAACDLSGLGSLTKGLALRCFRTTGFWAATQWQSSALFIHVKFGPLSLATAYTPAHSTAETLTYGFAVTDDKLRASMGDQTIKLLRPPADFWIDGDDVAAMQALQARIEGGERFCVPCSPQKNPTMRVPIARVPGTNQRWPGFGGEADEARQDPTVANA